MSINNINNLPNFGNSVNGIGSNAGPGASGGASSPLAKGDIDWFSSAGTGKTTPITAQDHFAPDASLDDMVSAIVGQLGL